MEFSEIVEYAKSGLELPKISSQSEHLAYLTVICILEAFRNRTINGTQAKNQREKAEQLFHDARKQEADRLNGVPHLSAKYPKSGENSARN